MSNSSLMESDFRCSGRFAFFVTTKSQRPLTGIHSDPNSV